MFEGRVLVTGAAGFLGRTVCGHLADEGFTVRAMTHSSHAAINGCERVVADLTDSISLRCAMDDVDAVVHLAARVHVMRETERNPLAAFRRVNVEGTAALLDAARAAGVRRLIFISSVKAVRDRSSVPLTSASECTPSDPYGTTKFEAESLVREIAQSSVLETSTLRLPLAYGPGMTGNMLRLFDWVRFGLPAPFGGVDNARSIVYSGNVAAAISHVLRMSSLPSGPFFVSDSADLSTPDLFRVIAHSLGKRSRLLSLPGWLLKMAARHAASRPGTGLPLLPSALDRLIGSLRVDHREMYDRTGFVPPYSTADGMRITAAWYLAREHRRAK